MRKYKLYISGSDTPSLINLAVRKSETVLMAAREYLQVEKSLGCAGGERSTKPSPSAKGIA